MTRRGFLVLMWALVLWALLAGGAYAAEASSWPAYRLNEGQGWSGPGYYLSLGKVLACWIVFLLWVRTTDWVSQDCQAMRLEYLRWNPIVFGSFMAAMVLVWLIPWFWLGFPLLVIAYAAPLTVYILYRNGRVGLPDRVLTRAHFRYWVAQRLGSLGVKMKAEIEDPHKEGPPVVLVARGGPTEREENARALAARQAPGFRDARALVAEGLKRRADAIMVDFAAQSVAVRHLVDGVWQSGESLDRETGDPAAASLKLLCGLNPNDRKNRQEGKFAVEYRVLKKPVFDQIDRVKEEYKKKIAMELTKELAAPELDEKALLRKVNAAVEEKTRARFVSAIGPWTPMADDDVSKVKYAGELNPAGCLEAAKAAATLQAQGIPTGERLLIQLEGKKIPFSSLDEIGMRTKMQEQVKEMMAQERGLLLFSAVPGGGLRTTMNVVLREADRFTREFVAVEEETNRYEPVENVPVTTYKAADGQTPATILADVFHREPNVLVVRDLVNAETVKLLLDEIPRARLIISTARARDAVEAVLRVLALGVPQAELARRITGVVNQRLIRKLCEHCRQAYAPPPQVLAQLGIPEGRVPAFYRPPAPTRADEKDKEICAACGGIGYLGRTALVELIVVNDGIRKALATSTRPDAIRLAVRQAGMRNLQEEGILLVAKGVTSLEELMRVLREHAAAGKPQKEIAN